MCIALLRGSRVVVGHIAHQYRAHSLRRDVRQILQHGGKAIFVNLHRLGDKNLFVGGALAVLHFFFHGQLLIELFARAQAGDLNGYFFFCKAG